MIKITFPDGNVKEFAKGTTAYQIAESISPRLAADSLAASVNGATVDLNRAIEEDASIKFYKWDDPEGKHAFWHTSSHLLAEALEALYPGIKFGIGPAIENGFYYDVDSPVPITEADLETIEKKMIELSRNKEQLIRTEVSKADALKNFTEKGDPVLHQRRIHRPLPGTAPAQHGVDQGHQAHLGRRSLLARQREEQDAHPHLRHLLPQEVDARRVSGDDGGGQETRPPQAGQGAGAFLLLATRRPGATPVASQRRCPARPPGTVPARRTEGVRLPAGHHAPHRQ